jgi:DNA-binding transcriptional regulator YiaG
MKKAKETTVTSKGIGGLRYVEVRGIPARVDDEFGSLIQADTLKEVEHQVARAILASRPLCGREVEFLRKVLGMSRRALARDLQMSDPGIKKWEDAPARKRLEPHSEVVVRVYFAMRFDAPFPARFEDLLPAAVKDPLVLEFQRPEAEGATAAQIA